MIVCSCNKTDTALIRANVKNAIEHVKEPNERLILNMMGWEPECSQCTKILIAEIRKVFEEINNQSLAEEDGYYGC